MPSSVRSITVAPVVAAWCSQYAAAPEKVEAMAAQLHSGVGLEDRDPILGLRNGLIGAVAANGSKKNDRRHAMTRSSHFKRTLLAIDARLSGRTLARVTSNATNLQDLKCFARFAKANGMEVRADLHAPPRAAHTTPGREAHGHRRARTGLRRAEGSRFESAGCHRGGGDDDERARW